MPNAVRSNALEIHRLRKTYPGGVTALNGLDLTVPAGAIFGLLGPNGAGKTTAVKILTTLSRQDSGSAIVAGADVLADPATVRRVAGYVPQRSSVDAQATGVENLMLQARVHGLERADAHVRVAGLLERFGLDGAAGRLVKTWSGGMRRRLDVALAMVHSPRVLFLDEPTTGLDPEVRADLWAEIRRLRDEDQVTVLLTTHYLEEADQLADRIAILDVGDLVAEGTPSELKDDMRGDGLHFELRSPSHATAAVAVLEADPAVTEIVVRGKTVHARAERGAEAVPRTLAAMGAAGVEVSAVTVNRPSLDDVFLRHTGRRFDPSEVPA
jgi:ABC-2 type transport system ATP-binding protein